MKKTLRVLSLALALMLMLMNSGLAEVLRYGKEGDEVAKLQAALTELTYYTGEIDGKFFPFPDRATAYRSNVWEHFVTARDRNYTYYLPLDESMSGKEITVYTLFCDETKTDVKCDLWLCPKH